MTTKEFLNLRIGAIVMDKISSTKWKCVERLVPESYQILYLPDSIFYSTTIIKDKLTRNNMPYFAYICRYSLQDFL
jgi:hypothetical protein